MRDFLQEIVTAAVNDLGGTTCSIAFARDGQVVPAVSTDSRAARLEAWADDHPQRTVIERRCNVHIADARADSRWPAFAGAVAAEGLRSVLLLHIDIDEPENPTGVLAVYGEDPHMFDASGRQRELARLADETGRALALVTRLERSETRGGHLEDTLMSRATIDKAVGIVMAQNRCSDVEAFAILRRASMNRNVKLRTIAHEIVQQVSGSAPSLATFS